MNTLSIIVTHTLDDGSPTGNPDETGMLSRGMARNRAVALAVMNGRSPQEVLKADWEEAKRGLTGGQEMGPRQTRLESLP